MPPKASGDPKRRNGARRKVALACDSCREKKVRCDGNKPICGPCKRRSYRIDQCLYNPDNARTASRDEYFQTLHLRIRELESACLTAGLSIDSSLGLRAQQEPHSELNRSDEIPVETSSIPMAVPTSFGEPDERVPTSTGFGDGIPPEQAVLAARSESENSRSRRVVEQTTECSPNIGSYESPLFDDGEAHVTGMGQITAPDAESRRQSSRFQFYGSSSTASLMRFAWQSMPSRPANASSAELASSTLQDTFTEYRFDDFVLPPRTLADYLVRCFFDHVYTLYLFFHRPAFEAAYRNLWRAEDEAKIPLTDLRIGLGSGAESGPRSIVFHAALNSIFALGCQFADIEDVESVAHCFFLRSKRFIGLDFLDINTLGVVQTLLITALFLQSSPYPSRCWHSVGVACRVALGLGLHESDILASLSPLESDIRRRTWHGCVMMDVTLSMTYGRPTMTTHLTPLPPPEDLEMSRQSPPGEPSLLSYYIEAIKLYNILDRILSDVYYAWCGRTRQDRPQASTKSLGGLDTILGIEKELTLFEANLPSCLKWDPDTPELNSDGRLNQPIAHQKNVLHARYLHLHLLLHRPMFTQLYLERVRNRDSVGGNGVREEWSAHSSATRSALYLYTANKSATACVMAAIDLTHLVHETYHTNATDAWWYNGFSRFAWREATGVLESMATVRRSANNTLQFLKALYRQAVPADVRQTASQTTGTASLHSNTMAQPYTPFDHPDHDLTQAPFFNWEEYVGSMGQSLDDLGFLTRLDFPDTLP
ncbi:fungal specific transcription factor [Aspergillus luchuensis]|uniref:Fungal specific transcription factor n=1 Tax=Aspergillus kawachii TaxID=1069201 RepID=A0A146FHG6_ASPKA|nr:fungal specific transcription factor [Aspergillus luchuensis]